MLEHDELVKLIGVEFKDRKVFSEAINEKYSRDTRSKNFQDQRWNTYFSFHRVGRIHVIDEVFDTKKVRIRPGNNSKYAVYLKPLIYSHVANDGKEKNYTLRQLAFFCGLSNQNYVNEQKRKEIYEQDWYIYGQFMFETEKLINARLKASLESLEKCEEIDCKQVFIGVMNGGNIEASDEQVAEINEHQKEVLKSLKCDNVTKLHWKKNGMKMYIQEMNKFVDDKFQWDTYFIGYKIKCKKATVILNADMQEEYKKQLNERIVLRLKQRFSDIVTKNNEDVKKYKEQMRGSVGKRIKKVYELRSDYIKEMEKMIDLFIEC